MQCTLQLLLWQCSKQPASDELVREPAFPSVSILAASVVMPAYIVLLLSDAVRG